MTMSSNPHDPLKKTMHQVSRCREIMEQRVAVRALVKDPGIVNEALQNMRDAETSLQDAFQLLFGDD